MKYYKCNVYFLNYFVIHILHYCEIYYLRITLVTNIYWYCKYLSSYLRGFLITHEITTWMLIANYSVQMNYIKTYCKKIAGLVCNQNSLIKGKTKTFVRLHLSNIVQLFLLAISVALSYRKSEIRTIVVVQWVNYIIIYSV